MKVTEQGHKYNVYNFDDVNEYQEIVFIKKDVGANGLVLSMSHDGTTNEEVLAVLIDRISFLNTVMPCRENALVITKLEEALMWLNKRRFDRAARGVNGTNEK